MADSDRRMAAFCQIVLERFRAKHAPGLDPGVDTGSREENASKQKTGARF
jgi:hypothetical protein